MRELIENRLQASPADRLFSDEDRARAIADGGAERGMIRADGGREAAAAKLRGKKRCIPRARKR